MRGLHCARPAARLRMALSMVMAKACPGHTITGTLPERDRPKLAPAIMVGLLRGCAQRSPCRFCFKQPTLRRHGFCRRRERRSFLPLGQAEGAERREAHLLQSTPCGVSAPCDRRASPSDAPPRRLRTSGPCFRARTIIQAAFAALRPVRVQPLKADPCSRSDGDPRRPGVVAVANRRRRRRALLHSRDPS
jgi:hypothetical protein